jgi:hypothetical protein
MSVAIAFEEDPPESDDPASRVHDVEPGRPIVARPAVTVAAAHGG